MTTDPLSSDPLSSDPLSSDLLGFLIWQGLLELLPQIDVLLCNQREVAAIAGLADLDPRGKWELLDEAVRRSRQ